MKTIEQLKSEQSELLKKKAEYEENEKRLTELNKEIAIHETILDIFERLRK